MSQRPSVLSELKRRKVYQTGAGYVVAIGALWGLVEIAGDAFAWPARVLQVVILASLAGFPVALLAAWVFELRIEAGTAPRLRTTRAVGLGIAAGVLTFAGLGLFVASQTEGGDESLPVFENHRRMETPGSVREVSISPDGQWVAYREERSGAEALYVRRLPDGEPLLVSEDGNLVRWIGDDGEFFYWRPHPREGEGFGLYRTSPASGPGTWVAELAGYPRIDVSPDGRFLAEQVLFDMAGDVPRTAVTIRSLEGSSPADTIGMGYGWVQGILWHPDGSRLLVVTSNPARTRVLGVDGAVQADLPGEWLLGPLWTPDGQSLRFRGTIGDRETLLGVTLHDLLAGDFRPTPWVDGLEIPGLRSLELSSNGDIAAYVRADESETIRLATVTGERTIKEVREVSRPDFLWTFHLSPSGDQLALATGTARGHELSVLPVDGGPARQLVSDSLVTGLTWRADGAEIAFLNNTGVVAVSTEGGPMRQMAAPEVPLLPNVELVPEIRLVTGKGGADYFFVRQDSLWQYQGGEWSLVGLTAELGFPLALSPDGLAWVGVRKGAGDLFDFVAGRTSMAVFTRDGFQRALLDLSSIGHRADGDAAELTYVSWDDPDTIRFAISTEDALSPTGISSTLWKLPVAGGGKPVAAVIGAGGEPLSLSTSGDGPRWSADGRRVAWRERTRRGELWIATRRPRR